MKADDPVFKDNDLYIAAFNTYLKVIAQETLAEMRDDEYGVDLNDCLIDLENH